MGATNPRHQIGPPRAILPTVTDPYRWTRWAAPEGAGHGVSGWVAIGLGLLFSVWVFYLVVHAVAYRWLAIPAAILAWFAATSFVGMVWALVRVAKRHGL